IAPVHELRTSNSVSPDTARGGSATAPVPTPVAIRNPRCCIRHRTMRSHLRLGGTSVANQAPMPARSLPLLLLLAGCPDRSIAEVSPVQGGSVKKSIPVSADIDILFVIDNSSSTLDKQTVFAQNFPRFVQALDAFPQGRPNLHIGVVNTTVDIGAQG